MKLPRMRPRDDLVVVPGVPGIYEQKRVGGKLSADCDNYKQRYVPCVELS